MDACNLIESLRRAGHPLVSVNQVTKCNSEGSVSLTALIVELLGPQPPLNLIYFMVNILDLGLNARNLYSDVFFNLLEVSKVGLWGSHTP